MFSWNTYIDGELTTPSWTFCWLGAHWEGLLRAPGLPWAASLACPSSGGLEVLPTLLLASHHVIRG